MSELTHPYGSENSDTPGGGERAGGGAVGDATARGGGTPRRALRPIRRLLGEARAPTFTRSPLEDRFIEFYREHLTDLPEPLTNVSILDHEVDAYWPGHRLVVELDGFSTHAHRAAFESDRARDAKMQAAGYRVLRYTHRRLHDELHVVAAELRAILTNPSPAP